MISAPHATLRPAAAPVRREAREQRRPGEHEIEDGLEAGMHDRERAAEDRRPDEPEVEREVADLDPGGAVERERGRAREQLALGEEELPAVDQRAKERRGADRLVDDF